jgi:hypothetical protein
MTEDNEKEAQTAETLGRDPTTPVQQLPPDGKREIIDDKVDASDYEKLLRDSTDLVDDTGIKEGDRVQTGDNPYPMGVASKLGAGYRWMYDTETGAPSPQSRNMIPSKLKERREDGSTRWTLTDPGFRPKVGTILCMLHKDAEDRKLWDELGLPICRSNHIKNGYMRRRHMETRHKNSWSAVQDHYDSIEQADLKTLQEEQKKTQENQNEILSRLVDLQTGPAKKEKAATK